MEQGRKAQGLEQDGAKESVRAIHRKPRSARMRRGHEVARVGGIAAATVAVEEDPAKVLGIARGESNEALRKGLSCGETVDHANTRYPRKRRVMMSTACALAVQAARLCDAERRL